MEQPFQITGIVFGDFELLDLFGPLEMFGLLQEKVSIRIASAEGGLVRSSYGPAVASELTFAQMGKTDLIVLPGGRGTRPLVSDGAFLESLRGVCERSDTVFAVCTGSALLAKAGLLEHRRATSNRRAFDWVAQQGPHVLWDRTARWVVDGKYYTSAGISAGTDMALKCIADKWGAEIARGIAIRAEYESPWLAGL